MRYAAPPDHQKEPQYPDAVVIQPWDAVNRCVAERNAYYTHPEIETLHNAIGKVTTLWP